jgi:hypothetical protein
MSGVNEKTIVKNANKAFQILAGMLVGSYITKNKIVDLNTEKHVWHY